MHGLTFESHYALVALSSMARRQESRVLQMREISARENLPAPFLSKILLKLRHAGIIYSRHGRGGGYALARSPFEITVRDVLMACSESPVAFDLTNPAVAQNPALSEGLAKLNTKLDHVLSETSIGELAGLERKTETASPRVTAPAPVTYASV